MREFFRHHIDIYFILVACAIFAVNGALSKLVSDQISASEIVFFRNFLGLIIMYFVLRKSGFKIGAGGKAWLLAFRGIIGAIGVVLITFNVTHIDLATALTFQKTGPIFTAVFCSIFLAEKLSLMGWSAVFLGFIGALFVIQPNIGISVYDIVGIAGGMCAGLAYTSVHELRKYYSTSVIIIAFMSVSTLVAVVLMILGGFGIMREASSFSVPDFKGWILVALIGITGAFYQIYVTKAYAATKKAGIVATFSYSEILFGLLIGIVFLGDEMPNLWTFIGIFIIVLSGFLIAREK